MNPANMQLAELAEPAINPFSLGINYAPIRIIGFPFTLYTLPINLISLHTRLRLSSFAFSLPLF